MTGSTGPAKALLVDDRRDNLTALAALLQGIQVETVAVTSGEEALKQLLVDDFAVILLDAQMPDMDGFETVRQLRVLEAGAPNHRRAYVVACTAFTLPGDREKCFDSGMDNYIGKPVTKAAFARMIAYFLTHHAADRKKVTEFSHA